MHLKLLLRKNKGHERCQNLVIFFGISIVLFWTKKRCTEVWVRLCQHRQPSYFNFSSTLTCKYKSVLLVCFYCGLQFIISSTHWFFTDRNILEDSYYLVKHFRISRSMSTELILLMKTFALMEVILYSQSRKSGKWFTT